MTVEISQAYLLDRLKDEPAPAELWDAITEKQLEDWENLWRPATVEGLRRLMQAGVPPREWPHSLHWDWRKKAQAFHGVLAKPSFSVMCGGVTQGLMFLDLSSALCRIPSQAGKHLVYIEYVESAPWNRTDLMYEPQFSGVGVLLVRAAIEFSRAEGFGGRIGLHSLVKSEPFYRTKCRMSEFGPDPDKENLRYFEMTAQQADAFTHGWS